ncbi:MAG: translation initiation factor IF-3 [Oligoflexales bacterium]|nr:translation initiation factor IF-3 [Oligoflexales bacterium]
MERLSRTEILRLGSKVRLVGEGLNEIVSPLEAYNRAEEQGLDLILLSTDATPPVLRIQDLKKLEYEKKKAKKSQKHAVSVLKEVQFKINISEHDLATKVSKIEKFLERGDKVKISLRLKGRERENMARADELISKVIAMVPCKASKSIFPTPMALLEPVKVASPAKVAAPKVKAEGPATATKDAPTAALVKE